MKNSSLPSLRVDAGLRIDAEHVLHQGESLSSFLETAVRDGIRMRKLGAEFIARGIAAGDNARQTGEYYSADQILGELEEMLLAKKTGGAA